MTDYTDIITRLEAAGGADRELDGAILNALFSDARLWIGESRDYGARRSSDFTASLDASLALVSEKLPGWFWKAGYNPRMAESGRYWFEVQCPARDIYREAAAPTPSLAVLLALFKALQGEEGK